MPAAHPDLEVQVRAGGVAGVADAAQRRACGDGRALRDGERAGLAVREEEVAAVGGVLDDVVARGGGLVGRRGDRAGGRRDDLRALGGEDVLALVRVADAPDTEAV